MNRNRIMAELDVAKRQAKMGLDAINEIKAASDTYTPTGQASTIQKLESETVERVRKTLGTVAEMCNRAADEAFEQHKTATMLSLTNGDKQSGLSNAIGALQSENIRPSMAKAIISSFTGDEMAMFLIDETITRKNPKLMPLLDDVKRESGRMAATEVQERYEQISERVNRLTYRDTVNQSYMIGLAAIRLMLEELPE